MNSAAFEEEARRISQPLANAIGTAGGGDVALCEAILHVAEHLRTAVDDPDLRPRLSPQAVGVHDVVDAALECLEGSAPDLDPDMLITLLGNASRP